MTANENNRRYLAEAWIDEDKDEEFKKSFLENLLNQLEHHKTDRSGFDADMVDGKHYCDISKEIDEKVEGFLRDFSIGKIHIANENGNEYTLGFDAVTLFPNIDGYNEDEKTLPWDENPRTISPSLMQVFRELYNQVTEKANQDDVDRINDTLYGIEDDSSSNSLVKTVKKLDNIISNITDENGNINATYLNGIQLFIMSESAYAQESEANKNNIKHLYIVKPDDEIGEEYEDGVVTDNPTVAELSRYYKFRIIDQTKDGVTQTWLQCRYEWGSEDEDAVWQDIAPTSDFMDNNTIQELIENYLAGNDYSLNPNVVKGAFDQINFNKLNTASLPTQWLLRNFLAGAKYQNKIVTLNDNTLIRTCPNQGNSMYLDLDALVDNLNIEDAINSKLSEYWKRIYPIGSIYISMDDTSPAELFGGGTWEKIEGKFLLASDTNHEPATTGGQEKVQLSNNNIPSHAHSNSHTHGAPSGGMPYMVSKDDIKINLDNYREWPKKVSSGGIHIVYAPKGAKYGIESRSNTGVASPQNTGYVGEGQAHENMPPYLSVNMWRRTA